MCRPTKYKKAYCKQLVKWMSEGLSFESFGSEVDVNRDTLYEWAKVHPEFSDAKKLGFTKRQAVWEKRYAEMAVEGGPGNPSMMIFGMKNVAKWTDKQEVEHQGGMSINMSYEIVGGENDE